MASKVDMSLDEIIVKTKGNRRGRGGRGASRGARALRGNRGQSRGAARPVAGRGRSAGRGQRGVSRPARANFRSQRGSINGRWSHDMYYGGASVVRTVPSGPTKLNITNLDYGVSDSDIKELFSEFGNMRAAAVHYDRSGRSLGTAHVIFDRRSDAQKAINQYNGVHLDGRPMSIAIDGENSAASLNGGGSFRLRGGPRNVKRLQAGPKPIAGVGGRGRRGMPAGRGRGGASRRGGSNVRGGGNVRGGTSNRRGTGIRRGGAGNRRGGRGGKQKAPTAAELDAELDSYRFQTSK